MKKIGLLALVLTLVVLGFFVFRNQSLDAIDVKLEPGPPQPRVSAADAGIDQVAIEQAVEFAGKHDTAALIIGRGGHIVFEKYWGDTTIDTVMPPGDFATALVPLLVGSAVNDRLIASLDEPVSNYLTQFAGTPTGAATLRNHLSASVVDSAAPSVDIVALVLEHVTKQPYEMLVKERLWQPLGGGEFSIVRKSGGQARAGAASAGCCLSARLGDWMRVGELLANDGVFEGNQFTPPRYVASMLKPTHKDSPTGLGVNVAGTFAARNVAWLGAAPGHRLWIVPSLRLVILRVGGANPDSSSWDEAMIPDSIVRGTSGWQPTPVGEGVDPNKYAPH